MGRSRRERQPWEYADGPTVGEDVPITGEPREESAPGVPAPAPEPEPQTKGGGNGAGVEEREVKSEDPDLSADTNARLTSELRDAVGADRVKVPADRPEPSTAGSHDRGGPIAYLNIHRFQLIRSAAIVLTFGAIVALATGKWWVLPIAAAVHALGTTTVGLSTIRLTTLTEHPSPQLAAALSEEGVSSPDARFSEMVDEFRPESAGDTMEVLTPGSNERTTEASAEPAAASAEQSSAMTPGAQPSESGGERGAPDLVIWATAISLLVISVIVPAVSGGRLLWLLPAVMVPLIAAWMVVQWAMVARPDRLQVRGRVPVATIIISTAIAVGVFCTVIALAFQGHG